MGESLEPMAGTARRAATATLVAGAIVVAALALWKIRIVIALLFIGFVIASAMRPSVEWLHRRAGMPRSVAIVLHYLAFLAVIAAFLYLVVPVALTQIDRAIGHVPTSPAQLHHAATHSHGIRHEILSALDKRLRQLPSGASLLHPAITVTRTLFEILVGIVFVFAVGAYWIFERDATIGLVQSFLPRRHRRVTRDTWVLIDKKLGAFVRGELLLIAIVAMLLSLAFWLDGEPYWLLIGTFAGVVELVPIVGPLAAGVVAVGAYWIFERDATIGLVQSLLPRRHRRVTRDTWVLIDKKLGAFVRGEFLLIVIVATLLSLAFWLDGEPYWLLIGTFAGVVELVPIVGPLAAGVVAVGVGLTADWKVALGAGIAVLVLRQLEDYLIAPRVMGHAVGLSPLVVLVSVVVVGYLLGAVYVLIAIPLASVAATLVDVVLRDRDPAREEAPAVLFPGAGEAKR